MDIFTEYENFLLDLQAGQPPTIFGGVPGLFLNLPRRSGKTAALTELLMFNQDALLLTFNQPTARSINHEARAMYKIDLSRSIKSIASLDRSSLRGRKPSWDRILIDEPYLFTQENMILLHELISFLRPRVPLFHVFGVGSSPNV